jgi:hypothetical protein
MTGWIGIPDRNVEKNRGAPMEALKSINPKTARQALVVWALACMLAAFFIPQYDFGLDGVKVWMYLCVLMLAVMIAGLLTFGSQKSRQKSERNRSKALW